MYSITYAILKRVHSCVMNYYLIFSLNFADVSSLV